MTLDPFIRDPLLRSLAASAVLTALVFLIRAVALRLIRHGDDVLSEQQRRRLFYARSFSNGVLAVGLVAIWLAQLQNLVLSLTAVIVAVVIATKELILCISGFVLRAGARPYSVGDWIEVNGMRGEVVDYSLLSTTLLELEPPPNGHGYTGRSVVIPNSLLLLHPVRNENFARNYVLHRFTLTMPPPVNAVAAKRWIERRSAELCRPFADVARRYNALLERKLGVDMPGPAPMVSVSTTDLGNVQFDLVLFCPTKQASALEQAITTEFLGLAAQETFCEARKEPVAAS
ncbi:MAG TPA: mechanosensitive ion channel family protein [Alphaproteobacteria bacterium]|nr:mechanosensitive ion channel family protein [Alphaproteobacteria bacterium]